MRKFALAFALACAASPAFAAGFGLNEHSADAMAASYAGAAATDRDASYLAYNPASLAGVADTDFAVSAVEIGLGSRADYTAATTAAGTPTGGGAHPSGFISTATVPAFGFRHRLGDRWAIGVGITAPWGLRSDYRSDWAGRYYALKSQLLTINIAPAISYQLTSAITLAAGAQIEFAQGALTSAIDTGTLGALNGIPGAIPGAQDSFARLSGKSWAFGYSAGAMVRPLPGLTLGLSYRSSLQHDLKGPLTFTLDGAGIGATIRALTGLFANTRATAPLTMPDMIEFGARQDISDDWTGLVELNWTHWSRFRALTAIPANPAQPPDVTTERWHDTLFASVGAEYRMSPAWAFRAGAGYDESPVNGATLEPRIPDGDRYWLSAGMRARLSQHLDLNLTAARVFNPKAAVALTPAIPGAALRGSLNGATQFYVNVAGLQITWRR